MLIYYDKYTGSNIMQLRIICLYLSTTPLQEFTKFHCWGLGLSCLHRMVQSHGYLNMTQYYQMKDVFKYHTKIVNPYIQMSSVDSFTSFRCNR